MDMKMDKDTQRAWNGWVNFTHAATASVVVIAIVLSLMAFFLV
jgi:hypothetical protein